MLLIWSCFIKLRHGKDDGLLFPLGTDVSKLVLYKASRLQKTLLSNNVLPRFFRGRDEPEIYCIEWICSVD